MNQGVATTASICLWRFPNSISSLIGGHHPPSINASIHSNHVLQPITQFNNEILIKLYTFLHSNHKTDKLAVAHKKIHQHHSLENVEFIASSLANVLSSVGNADSQLSLCQLCGIFRIVPHIN